ncbi:fibronectin type III domain-containing protein [Enterococcus durans]|uniref:fibronectin type III domain-containing protein n=1 Tax=Enterococcus durans TaxID=53345 RepID=UPI00193B8AEF|nr:glycosyl hydrolase family 18 protein [Enterococcus durans]MBM1152257.1 fibronectin type III domain-containing protein [Enterococcus durans]
MKKKTVLFPVGLFGTLLGGGTTVLAADAADTMPDISNKQISVGYYHNWEAERGAGYRGGKPANLELDKINSFYNVIAVAFMKGEGIPTFKPYNISDQEFREKVAVLNNEGRVVLMSLGGADSHVELHKGEEQAFANEIIRLVERYGFDGLDIDLEQTAVEAGDNQSVIPAALKIVREHYQKENKHFIISMAPEFPYLRNNQAYTPYVRALENEYDFIAPQLYNQAGDGISIGTEWIAQNNDSRKYDFLYGISKSFNEGSGGFIQIPANKLAIGIPANEDAAANGFVKDPTTVYQVFEQMEKENTPLKGVMTWSANWDEGLNSAGVAYNESFAKSYQNLFKEKTPDTEKPSKQTNLTGTTTHSTVSINWTPSTDNVRVSHYNIYQDNQFIGTSTNASYTVTNLTPETQYSFSIEAVDAAGNRSLRSDVLMMTTNKETGQTQKPSAPRELTVENLTQNSVTFRWAANDASEKVTQYEIYRSGIRVGVTGGTTFSDAGLMAATRYEYQVKAVNAVGTSDASPSIAVTTLGESPQGDTWTSGKAYGVGEIVTYKGGTYRCLQAHTAIPSWTPDITAALWQKIS